MAVVLDNLAYKYNTINMGFRNAEGRSKTRARTTGRTEKQQLLKQREQEKETIFSENGNNNNDKPPDPNGEVIKKLSFKEKLMGGATLPDPKAIQSVGKLYELVLPGLVAAPSKGIEDSRGNNPVEMGEAKNQDQSVTGELKNPVKVATNEGQSVLNAVDGMAEDGKKKKIKEKRGPRRINEATGKNIINKEIEVNDRNNGSRNSRVMGDVDFKFLKKDVFQFNIGKKTGPTIVGKISTAKKRHRLDDGDRLKSPVLKDPMLQVKGKGKQDNGKGSNLGEASHTVSASETYEKYFQEFDKAITKANQCSSMHLDQHPNE
ncbi:unnamed protein product [Lupinus luteus]|uniref:Uncharacterized protein n=1 Tax=Lupinus luteus TaxID=3873 RepID=A0AAV1XSK8_LUPLU